MGDCDTVYGMYRKYYEMLGALPPLNQEQMEKLANLQQEKEEVSLVDPQFIRGMAKALMYGKSKYKNNNRIGYTFPHTKNIDSALRHIYSFLEGEDLDKESGVCHLYHAATRLMHAAHVWESKNSTLDDRWKP